jgi:uncharacterized membrane protein YccC
MEETMRRYSRKKLITAVALLGLRERCDRAATKLERAGDPKAAFVLDRLAAKIQRALNEMPEATEGLVKGNLMETLESLLELNEQEQEILTEALEGVTGAEEEHEFEEEFEEHEFGKGKRFEDEEEEFEDEEEEFEDEEEPKKKASARLAALRHRLRLARAKKMRAGILLRPSARTLRKSRIGGSPAARIRHARLRKLRKFRV